MIICIINIIIKEIFPKIKLKDFKENKQKKILIKPQLETVPPHYNKTKKNKFKQIFSTKNQLKYTKNLFQLIKIKSKINNIKMKLFKIYKTKKDTKGVKRLIIYFIIIIIILQVVIINNNNNLILLQSMKVIHNI